MKLWPVDRKLSDTKRVPLVVVYQCKSRAAWLRREVESSARFGNTRVVGVMRYGCRVGRSKIPLKGRVRTLQSRAPVPPNHDKSRPVLYSKTAAYSFRDRHSDSRNLCMICSAVNRFFEIPRPPVRGPTVRRDYRPLSGPGYRWQVNPVGWHAEYQRNNVSAKPHPHLSSKKKPDLRKGRVSKWMESEWRSDTPRSVVGVNDHLVQRIGCRRVDDDRDSQSGRQFDDQRV